MHSYSLLKKKKIITYLSEACASQACLKVKENIEAAPHVAPFFPSLSTLLIILNKTTI